MSGEESQIIIDHQLLRKKKQIAQEILNGSDRVLECLSRWPNPRIQELLDQKNGAGHISLIKSSQGSYFGQSMNEVWHGYGLLFYETSTLRFYQGYFQNHCKHGYGMQYIKGDVYIGKFINNKPQDESGIFIWSNGDVYHGGFVNGMKHGSGKWQSGGEFYSGHWKFNKPEGQGYIKSENSQYHGEIKNGYKHGNGMELFTNGDRYEGIYSNGKPEGYGAYFWNNGSVYRGQFKNGLRFGFGTWQYGEQKYQGNYVNDKRNGKGKYYWKGGNNYEGIFVDDLRHGYGQMHWSEGSVYKGEWAEGFQHGKGEIWEGEKLLEKGIYEMGKLKLNMLEESERKALPLPNFNRKIVNKRIVSSSNQSPVFRSNESIQNGIQQKVGLNQQNYLQGEVNLKDDRKRTNSFSINYNKRKSQQFLFKPNKNITSNHNDISKKNQDQLVKRRQINKRYSVLDSAGKSAAVRIEKLEKKNDFKFEEKRISMYNKIKIKKLQYDIKLRKDSTVPFESQTTMLSTQLTPIKWKNFGRYG